MSYSGRRKCVDEKCLKELFFRSSSGTSSSQDPWSEMIPSFLLEGSRLLRVKLGGVLFERIRVGDIETTARTRDSNVYLYRGLKIIGLDVPERLRTLYFIWSFFLNASVTIYLPTGFVLSFVMRISEFNPSQFLTSLQVAINCWGCSMKVLAMVFLQKRLRESEVFMNRLDARCKLPEEKHMIRKAVAFGNRTFVVFAASYWSYSSSTFLTSIVSGRPPYSVFNPFMNWRDSSRAFVLQSFMEYILMDFTCFQEVVVDSYPVIYINVIRTHLQILTERIRNLGANNAKLSNDERFEELIQCVLDHKNILDLFNTISPVISVTIFVQFLIMGCILGFTLINILIFADISAMVASFFYIIAVVVETFPCCFYANCLMDDSDDLALSIFHSSWPDEDERYKKVVAFFLHHTQKSLVLTAMKLFPITMDSNLNVAKFAFSVYTLMKQMDFGKSFKTQLDQVVLEE